MRKQQGNTIVRLFPPKIQKSLTLKVDIKDTVQRILTGVQYYAQIIRAGKLKACSF
jgi:hypothetical protein